MLRWHRRWWGVWVIGWTLCVALSLGPALLLPLPMGQGDKVGHLLAYATLMAWAVWLFPAAASRARAAGALVVLGLLMEVGQATLTTHRLFDPVDAVANAVGVALGWGLAAGCSNPLLGIERWALRRLAGDRGASARLPDR